MLRFWLIPVFSFFITETDLNS